MKKKTNSILAILLAMVFAISTVGCVAKNPQKEVINSVIDNANKDDDASKDLSATEEDSQPSHDTTDGEKEASTEDSTTSDEGDEDVTTEEFEEDTNVEDEDKNSSTEASTDKPLTKPTEAPSTKPSTKPTEAPTTKPSTKPTEAPTTKPTEAPTTKPTEAPTTAAPTQAPTQPPTTTASSWQPGANKTHTELSSLSNITDADIANARNILTTIITNQMTDTQKIRVVHDYLVKSTTYDTAYYSKADSHDHLENILVEKRAVCQGYAVAFYVFMKELGIPCTILTGNAFNGYTTESHAWNAVKLDGNWYFVDVTWDDPFVNDSTTYPDGYNLSYEYLLCTYNYISASHTYSEYTGEAPTPYGVSNSYNDQMYQSLGFDGVYRVSTLDKVIEVANAVTGNCTYLFIIEGDIITVNNVWDTFRNNLDVYKIGGYSVSASMSSGTIEITVTKS